MLSYAKLHISESKLMRQRPLIKILMSKEPRNAFHIKMLSFISHAQFCMTQNLYIQSRHCLKYLEKERENHSFLQLLQIFVTCISTYSTGLCKCPFLISLGKIFHLHTI